MPPQVSQHAADAPQGGELLEHQLHRLPHLFVGIELQFGVGPDDEARRRLAHPFAATGPVQATGLHALLDLVQFDTPHEPLNVRTRRSLKSCG